jgi:macrolide transport system ATP-binding/permease protein
MAGLIDLGVLRGDRMGTSGIALRDLIDEALAGLMARPGRSLLTVLGVVLGITALVATLGLSRTAGSQIVGRLSELAATEVSVQPAEAGGRSAGTLPWDAEDRLTRLNGVVAAGAYGEVDVNGALIRSVAVRDRTRQTEFALSVYAATPGVLEAVRGTMQSGRFIDEGMSRRNERVAVLGSAAAKRLGVTRVDNQPAIYIGDELYVVIGIIADTKRESDLLNAVIIPRGTANTRWGEVAPSKVIIETQLGAAQLIASQAALALSPNNPDSVRVTAPPDARRTRENVENDVNSLFLVLGLVSLVVGAIGIANVTLVTVLERVGEIGLRRALGARTYHVAAQFLLESTVTGVIGGIVGASAGILTVVGVSIARDWTPVMDMRIALISPVVGGAIGLLAGLYPALRAASLEPVEALRSPA